jgi:ankyrin repeat protein
VTAKSRSFYESRLAKKPMGKSLAARPRAEKRGVNDLSPTHVAAEEGKADYLHLLGEYGKNAFKGQDRFGQTPLHHAAMNGQFEACAVILKFDKSLPKAVDSSGQTPIKVAKKFGHMEIAQMLESGVSPYDNVQFRRADSKSWQQDYSTVRKTHLGAELWRPVAGPN